MRVKLYAGILVVFLIAASTVAVYAASNGATGNVAAEDSSDTCINTQASGNSCTAEQNCGISTCEALENKPCGCKRNTCTTC